MRFRLRWQILGFMLVSAAFLAGGVWFYRVQEGRMRREADKELQAIAKMKVAQIVEWRTERLADAKVLQAGALLNRAIIQWLKDSRSQAAQPILVRFRAMMENYHYKNVFLVDVSGKVRLSVAEQPPVHTEVAKAMADAFARRQCLLTDLHAHPGESVAHMDVVAPVFSNEDLTGNPVAAVVLQCDVEQYLYSLVRSWPAESETSEILLVRRDGDSILLLNNVRFDPAASLKRRIPLSRTDLPVVQAVLGKKGSCDGLDYRGVPVMAVLAPVPDSSWFLEAKIDEAEALAGWKEMSTLIVAILVGGMTLLISTAGAVWQRNRKKQYQDLLRSEEARRKSEERHRITLMSVGDAVIATDARGRVEMLNPMAEDLTGWSEADAMGQPIGEVFRIIREDTREPIESPVERILREGHIVGLASDALLIARDGTEVAIADSGAPIRDAQGQATGVVLVFRGVAQERQSQEEREAAIELFRLLNTPGSLRELIRNVTNFLHARFRCEAVGIRLRAGEDFPYFETRGFPADFLEAENFLCQKDLAGQIARDEMGHPLYECMCGNILCGRFDPSKPFFTHGGSFWTNSTTQLLATTTESDRQARTRNRCNGQGYESVALIPLRSEGRVLGLLQFNDRHPGRFTPASITLLERLANSLGFALAQRESQAALLESEQRLSFALETSEIGAWDLDLADHTAYRSIEHDRIFGYSQRLPRWTYEMFLTHVLPEDRAAVDAKFQQAVATRGDWGFECRIRRADGEVRWIWAAGRHRFNSAGSALRMAGIIQDITERKRAEEARRLDETRLEAMLDLNQMTEATLQEITDFALEQAVRLTQSTIGYLAFLNEDESVLTMHSWSRTAMRECMIGDKPLVYPVETTGLWGEAVRQRKPVITNDYAAPNPWKKGYPEGHVAVRRHMNVPIFDGARIVAVAGVGNKEQPYDETDVRQLTLLIQGMWRLLQRQQATMALCRSEQRQRTILDNIPDPAWLKDANGRFVAVNKAWTLFTGIGTAEAIGRTDAELFPPKTAAPLGEHERTVLETRQMGHWEETVPDAQGQVRYFETFKAPVIDPEGTLSGIIGISRDITDRKRAEGALRSGEAHLRAVLNSTMDGILAIDAAGKVMLFNRRFGEMWRIPQDVLTSRDDERLLDYAMTQLEDPVGFRREVQQLYGTDKENLALVRFKDGRIFERFSCPIHVGEQRQERLWSFHDITDRKRAEEQLQASQQQLLQAQKMEVIGQLAGGVAHDFRNQLTVIKGFGEMILRRSLVQGEGVEMLQEVLKAAERSTLLTGQLLAFSRKQQLETRHVNLTDVIADLGQAIPRITGESIRVSLAPSPERCMVEIDPGQFQQALINLVANARDAMPTGGQLTIANYLWEADAPFLARYRDARPGRYVVTTVTDTGCGMNEEVLQKIFEPFFTTKEVGRGTGLGLSMVYGFVRQSGGFIKVESQPGRGSTFTLFFPERQESNKKSASPTIPGAPPGGDETILVVEDEEAVRQMLVESLREGGYTVLEAANLVQADVAAHRAGAKLALLITDVVMPGGSGVEFAQQRRSLHPDLPVLYLSAYAEKELRHRGAAIDAGQMLSKPCTHEALLLRVRRLLDAAKKRTGGQRDSRP